MITLRSIFLYVGPIVAFALIVNVSLSILFPRPDAKPSELVGYLAFVSLALCGYTTRRLRPRKETPDLRIPYLFNAAGFGVIVGWFALSALIALWQILFHYAA